MLVAICVPHRTESDYREWRDWFKLKLCAPPDVKTVVLERRGESLCTMREGLAQQSIEAGADWLLFIDDDVIAPDSGLIKLLAVAAYFKSQFVSGIYWAKKTQALKSLAAWQLVDVPIGQEAWAEKKSIPIAIQKQQASDYVIVGAVGLGFSLIDCNVFKKLSKPWFDWPVGGPSEDFYFCAKARKELGILPLVDMSVGCAHIGLYKQLPDGTYDLLQL